MIKQRRTFTVIRKWAEKNGYKVEDTWAYGDQDACRVIVNEKLSFKAEMRNSTIYQSIRGQRGECAGLYLTEERKREEGEPYRRNYAFHMTSQKHAIENMESDIKKMERDANEKK
ncbi:hypothetical protein pW2_156 [Bacillus phage pW2]|uniref:Uncharacterized protein n=1 Tax=Bacillus phage pW2 TaxID=2500559 RepID=A0A3T0IHX9_9CAUD|nr:hypothetical protein PQE69_gp137 [Bacillus phage pW2]AZU98981.1 hypothetical protein pW2_156 [Bacillus phage pW2]